MAPPATLEIRAAEQPIVVEAHEGASEARLGPANSPDGTLSGPPRLVLGMLLGLLKRADAEAGGVVYRGEPALLDRVGAKALSPTAST
jgi:hypothetical protein